MVAQESEEMSSFGTSTRDSSLPPSLGFLMERNVRVHASFAAEKQANHDMLSVAIFRIPLQPKLRPAAWMSLKDNAIDLLGPISTVVQLF